jgi:hypothetical protein
MKGSIVLQILGTSDVIVNTSKGPEEGKLCLRGFDLNVIQSLAEDHAQELTENLSQVDFPLIRQTHDYLDKSAIFVVLLTDQTEWFEAQKSKGEGWLDIVCSDGHWWEAVLSAWTQKQGITCFPVHLVIPPEVDLGVADWEAMAQHMTVFLNQMFEGSEIRLPSDQSLPFHTLYIQHSSGTPALGSALYLWGIEKKLEKQPVEFLYLSRQNVKPRQHSGFHWQWRFKVPQIRQLLKIQDFAGILQLTKGDLDESLEKKIRFLDRASSFNLRELNLGLRGQDDVIERIAIGCWSEKGFRERGQWMHWILRVAGVFELLIKMVVYHQGDGKYLWEKTKDDGFVELLFQDPDSQEQVPVRAAIKDLAKGLSSGNFEGKWRGRTFTYTLKPIQNNADLTGFQHFYCNGKGWELSNKNHIRFAEIRNNLYHSLQGDIIDQLLDQKTQVYHSPFDSRHPAQVAVNHTQCLIQLAGIEEKIDQRVQHYQQRVQEVEESL